jgi:glucose-1-phosphate thymidylyltransferase
VKAIVLGAGYATRLYPLTESMPKQLLPVGGRPILDWIVDKLDDVPELDEVHVVTNSRYADQFRRWAEERGGGIRVHDDGTSSNEDRRGAIGDLAFTIDEAGLDDDLLVIAGDNLFDFSLADYAAFRRSKGTASAVAVLDVGDPRLASQYGIVELDAKDRIVDFVEKPANPPSTLAATALYLYDREHARLVPEYLAGGNPVDQPGNLVAWLHKRAPVYAYRFEGEWFDIGDQGQLLAADNRLRERVGLPQRAEYSLSLQN